MDVGTFTKNLAFGERVKDGRRALGLTQEALARRSGVSPFRIERLERGVVRPRTEDLERLGRVLGWVPPKGRGDRTARP